MKRLLHWLNIKSLLITVATLFLIANIILQLNEGKDPLYVVLYSMLVALLIVIWILQNSYRRRHENELKRQTQFLNSMIESMPDMVAYKDKDGVYRFCNSHSAKFFGLSVKESIGKTDADLFGRLTQKVIRLQDQQAKQRRTLTEHDAWVTNSENRKVLLHCYRQPMFDLDEEYIGMLLVCKDVTQNNVRQQKLEHMARHDSLTGLANRRMLYEQLGFALQMTSRNVNPLVVIFLDLDRFKEINDSLGHKIGDLLLRDVAYRLRNNLRDGDICARLGGDEFVIVLSQIDREHIQQKCKLLMDEVARPYKLEGHILNAYASAGIAIAPDHGNSAEVLLANADTALHMAKTQGRNRSYIYRKELSHRQHNLLTLEQDFLEAIENQKLDVFYQPQLCTGETSPGRVEALVRWKHPQLGFISPQEFIQIAETTGSIVQLGAWVLETACKQFIEWRQQGLMLEKIAINVSAMEIDASFAENVANTLYKLGFNPAWLELEVTESLMMSGLTDVTEQVHALRKLGVEFAIDDFGTGYSSLSKLKAMPVSVLKVDQSFVRRLHMQNNDFEIVRAIVAMAHGLGLTVVAEGVENAEQEAVLRELGCEWLQGYYFGKPITGDDFLAQFNKQQADNEQG